MVGIELDSGQDQLAQQRRNVDDRAGRGPPSVDLRATLALLLGALPVIALLRRHPPRISDRSHACAYVGLLGMVVVAMLLLA